MDWKFKAFAVFLCFLCLSICGSGQDIAEENHTNIQTESQEVFQTETLVEVPPEMSSETLVCLDELIDRCSMMRILLVEEDRGL